MTDTGGGAPGPLLIDILEPFPWHSIVGGLAGDGGFGYHGVAGPAPDRGLGHGRGDRGLDHIREWRSRGRFGIGLG